MTNFPSFYNRDQIGTLFYPDATALANEATAANLRPAASDKQQVHLLLIDMQIDFCHDRGSLHVPGAAGDIQRTIEFIFKYAGQITNITCTLDSHLPFQIFHPAWWADAEGNHPAPFTLITHDDVVAGRWRPLVDPDYSRSYVQRLEEQAKKVLTIWPYHVMMGGTGNALDPALWSAVIWHALARKSQPAWLIKGTIPQTEFYSAVQPEIPAPEMPGGKRNEALLATLEASDYLLIAGEAESHCVLETVEDIVEAFAGRPALLDKIYLLSDCMSPVVHPEIDFHAIAREQFARFKEQGVHIVKSSDSLPFLQAQEATAGVAETAEVVALNRMSEWT